ncbi:MAG: DUF2203 domain-containing protein [Planctomycetota bacterium]|jgi:hypothetical protein
MPHSPPTRLFTIDEANSTLPLVRRIVADILEAGHRLRELAPTAGAAEASEEIDRLQERISTHVDELRDLGCFYKDWTFDRGLVDFPAKLDGRIVLLCWRSDEERIGFYHELHAGYAGRQPIPLVHPEGGQAVTDGGR